MKRKGPWKVLQTKTVYENPWLSVYEDAVIKPDGTRGIYSTAYYKSGSNVLALDAKNRVLLAYQYQYGAGEYRLECISGGREKGETFLTTAKRELQEEAGLTAKHWHAFGTIEALTSLMRFSDHLWLARDLVKIKKSREGTEKIRLRWVSLEKAYAMVCDQKIVHAATVVLILRTWDLLAKERKSKKAYG